MGVNKPLLDGVRLPNPATMWGSPGWRILLFNVLDKTPILKNYSYQIGCKFVTPITILDKLNATRPMLKPEGKIMKLKVTKYGEE